MNLYLIFLILFFTALFPISLSSLNGKFDACSKKLPCGDLGDNIGYPFYDDYIRSKDCGYPGFQLYNCEATPLITISGLNYSVSDIRFDKHRIRVSRTDKWLNFCPDGLLNTIMDYSKFNFTSADQNITFFYDCDDSAQDLSSLRLTTTKCNLDGNAILGIYLTQKMLEGHMYLFKICKSNLFLPILQQSDDGPSDLAGMIGAFKEGFELGYMAENEACVGCMDSGGVCGQSWSSDFICHCADADYNLNTRCVTNTPPTSSKNGSKNKMRIIIGISIGSVVVLIALLGGCLVFTHSRIPSYILQKYKSVPQYQGVEDCLKNYASLVPKRYPYTYIEKITKSFREKLGEGGYGTVFKGNLQDGRAVAVKLWKQPKGDGQDFINEVMSISRTSHINIVPLLGFCFEGHKRALIYELMPNGSLEKFIHGRDFPLSTHKLFEIALGIGRGLEYLHRGCNTRMVHFDIKPHNILLDAEFTPKISDFGLAKSLKQKESIISMSKARGTIGYIAPEVVFSRFGGVSYKADVYSFGMMVLEMVGCRKRVNEHNVENSSETYFPQWIYKQLEQGTTIIDCEMILNEEEKELERKMILVGLGCIQTNPLSRPTMSRVVEMLEGNVDLLEIPPMPTLASPLREHQHATNDDSINVLSSSIYART